MMNFDDANSVKNELPRQVVKVLSFGHIGRDCFSDSQLYQLKNGELKELATQKLPMFVRGEQVREAVGLWGEDSEGIRNDTGIACIFINGNSYHIPQHFMSKNDFKIFIIDTFKEHYPEYII